MDASIMFYMNNAIIQQKLNSSNNTDY